MSHKQLQQRQTQQLGLHDNNYYSNNGNNNGSKCNNHYRNNGSVNCCCSNNGNHGNHNYYFGNNSSNSNDTKNKHNLCGLFSLSSDSVRQCDGPQCPGGCCPYADWVCCPDPTYCACDLDNCEDPDIGC